jgi:iron complex transport system substrate-binding protein
MQAGRALGLEREARRVVTDVEGRIASARREHAQLVGSTVSLTNVFQPGGIVTIQSQSDPAVRFLRDLGLVLAPGVARLPAGEFGNADLSLERLDVLEADVVTMLYASEALRRAIESSRLFASLPAVRRGAYAVIDLDTAIAMRTPSALSIPYALDRMVPKLAEALAR